MARPYSLDLRERVVARVAAGDRVRAIAELFGVSVSNVVKWSQRKRATGSAAAKPMGGQRRAFVLRKERERLLRRVAEKPDLTLRAIQAELQERGTKISYGALWNFFVREGLSFKKNSARQRARQTRRRKKTPAMVHPSRKA
jgi:transposase